MTTKHDDDLRATLYTDIDRRDRLKLAAAERRTTIRKLTNYALDLIHDAGYVEAPGSQPEEAR